MSRSHSWQAHLQRISSYLVLEELWWKITPDGFAFYDSDTDPDFRPEGPTLRHFQSCTFQDVEDKCKSNWQLILDSKVDLPTNILRIFDEDGNLVSLNNRDDNGLDDNGDNNGDDDLVNVTQTPSRFNCDVSSILFSGDDGKNSILSPVTHPAPLSNSTPVQQLSNLQSTPTHPAPLSNLTPVQQLSYLQSTPTTSKYKHSTPIEIAKMNSKFFFLLLVPQSNSQAWQTLFPMMPMIQSVLIQ